MFFVCIEILVALPSLILRGRKVDEKVRIFHSHEEYLSFLVEVELDIKKLTGCLLAYFSFGIGLL